MVLPANWVGEKKNGQGFFWYPSELPKRKVQLLIDSCGKPSESWSKIKIKRIKYLGDKRNCNQLEMSSCTEAEDDDNDTVVNDSFEVSSPSSASSDEEEEGDNSATSGANGGNAIDEVEPAGADGELSAAFLRHKFPLSTAEFQMKMLKLTLSNARKLDETNAKLETILDGGVGVSNTMPLMVPDFGTEAHDKEEFNKAEESLGNDEYFKEKLEQLCKLGGHSLRETVRLCSNALMSDRVKKLFSFTGRLKGKMAFKTTKHYMLIRAVAMNRHKDATEADINDEFKLRILRFASERLKSNERRQSGVVNLGFEEEL